MARGYAFARREASVAVDHEGGAITDSASLQGRNVSFATSAKRLGAAGTAAFGWCLERKRQWDCPTAFSKGGEGSPHAKAGCARSMFGRSWVPPEPTGAGGNDVAFAKKTPPEGGVV
jgi:hypothetical protein